MILQIVNNRFVLILLMASSLMARNLDKAYIDAIYIKTRSDPPYVYLIKKPKGLESSVQIDTEYDSDQFDIKIESSSPKAKLKVEQRYETSLSILNEGPHLDLINWKHFISDWVEVPAIGTGVHRSLLISEKESSQFPNIEFSDLIKEIKRKDPKWLHVIGNVRSIREYPFSVYVSTLTFRISLLIDNKWVPIHSVHCRRPTGC